MIRKLAKAIIPRSVLSALKNFKILSVDFGQFKSIRQLECVDADGSPIPWYSYPSIEYLKQLDVSDKVVFEYGSGNSTLFWAGRCKKVVSVEDNKEWYDKIEGKLPDHVDYLFLQDSQEYVESISRYPELFDIVVVDGSHRFECAKQALLGLRDDGFIILDNSDWKEKTSEFLRNADLIEVDMSGFGPINGYTWTTSFYFRRNVKLSPTDKRQPMHGIGSVMYRETE